MKTLNMAELTKKQFDAEMQKAFDSIEEGRVHTLKEVKAHLERLYGIKSYNAKGLAPDRGVSLFSFLSYINSRKKGAGQINAPLGLCLFY